MLAARRFGVALNGFLPANIGTFVMLLMFIAIIPGANLPGVLGGMLAEDLLHARRGVFVYGYPFASVPGARSSASSNCRTTIPAWCSRSAAGA